MHETPEQLFAQIQLGEDSSLELKAVHFAGDKLKGPERDDLADELVAFANGSGGTLVLGVDDKTRAVRGIPTEHLDQVERLITEVCHDAIRPPLLPRILRQRLPAPDGGALAVLRVDVPRSLFVHEGPSG